LIVPLEKPVGVRKIVGATLPAIFAGQLERLAINFVITDTVHLHIAEKLRKKPSAAVDSDQQYIHPDYGLGGDPRLTHDTVRLAGPKGVIMNLPDTLLVALPQNNIQKNFNENITSPPRHDNLITHQPQKINVSF